MRCPKCGYISFDQQKSCVKCSADVAAIADQLQGTVSNVQAPFFLGSVLGVQEEDFSGTISPSPAEDDSLDLGELEADMLPEENALAGLEPAEVDLDLAGAPLDDEDLGEAVLPPTSGLADIDVSDLIPPADADLAELSFGVEEDADALKEESAEDEVMEEFDLDLSPLDDDLLIPEEAQAEQAVAEEDSASAPAETEDEEIIDLSSLMDLDDDERSGPGGEDSDSVDLDLTLDDLAGEPVQGGEDSEPGLSLDDQYAPAPDTDESDKNRKKASDIPDLGLTLESENE